MKNYVNQDQYIPELILFEEEIGDFHFESDEDQENSKNHGDNQNKPFKWKPIDYLVASLIITILLIHVYRAFVVISDLLRMII